MEKYRVVAIMGKSASGKDSIMNSFCERYPLANKKISTTTRPPRDYEKDGEHYFFVSAVDFAEKVLNFEMIEATDFRDWFYGTEIKALEEDSINIGVFNPNGVRALLEDGRLDVLVFNVVAPSKIRLMRALAREEEPDVEEIFRRYHSDEEDFRDLDFDFFEIVNDGNSSMGEMVELIKREILKTWVK